MTTSREWDELCSISERVTNLECQLDSLLETLTDILQDGTVIGHQGALEQLKFRVERDRAWVQVQNMKRDKALNEIPR